MNGYERIKAALSGTMPDRRPVMLHNFMPAIREAGYTMREYRTDPEIAAECHIRYAEKYRLDGVLFDVDTAITASAIGAPVDYPEDEPARMHEIFLESLDEADKLADIDISQHPRIQHSLEAVRLIKKHFGSELFVRGNCDQAPFSLACSMRGPENFMMDLFMDEERVVHLLKYTTGICRQFIRLMSATGADMLSNGDSPAGPSMISPEMYEKFAMPYEKELVDEAHRCGLPYLLHICGDTRLILSQMNRLGLDAVELDYKTPIENIFEVFGVTTTLFGTIDPSGVIALGTPEMAREESVKILDVYRNSPRLVLGAGCAIPPMAPEENIRAIVDSIL
ncbi:MAG: uroporphyrinogen decarboxylase family protein [Prevotellaceae bacterium]|jgi:uroporphyrinogen decarboxylase|nr:uroporphyrinogen decarboxylase family protein [Prevotellaceae bacterium]